MKKMKKIVFCFVLMAGIMVSLSSCLALMSTTYKLVVDKNVSSDQTVLVTFESDTMRGWFSVKQWNNKDIVDELYGGKATWSNDKAKLTVPAGNNSFTFNVYYTFSTRYSETTHTFKDIELRYNLEQGREYQIKGIIKSLGIFKGYELFVGIYDVKGTSTLLKEWKLGET